MKTKATHQGECQICGRVQKLPKGLLSKHGYTVQWSCFMGTCWGADHLPLEQSKDLLEEAIRRAQAQAAAIRAEAAKLRARTGRKCWMQVYYKHSTDSRVPKGGYVTEEVELFLETVKYPGGSFEQCRYKDRLGNKHDVRLTSEGGNILKTYEERMELTAREHDEHKARSMDANVEKHEQYIAWQRKRIKAWKVQPLKEVAK